MDFRKELVKRINESVKIKNADELLEVPPKENLGDYALPCFTLGKNPAQTAMDLAKKIDYLPFIEEIRSTGPFVNFFIKKGALAKNVLSKIDEKYGSGKKKSGKVMIEYSQPNPLKAFHVGHSRNTILGDSLGRIMKKAGHNVLMVNYINDKGAHIGKWIWCYEKYHYKEKPPKNIERWLADIYAESYAKSENDDKAKEEIAKINKSIILKESKKYVSLWKQGVDWSLEGFKNIYNILSSHFDHYFFESPLNKRSSEIVELLLKKKLAKKSEGAVILDYEKYGLGVAVIRRADGTNLYLTSDFALAEEKFKKYKITKNIYVVGSEQRLHFKQLFKTLELMGFKQAKDCYHLAYELVRFPGKKMSSRTGDNKLFTEFFEEVKQLAKLGVEARHPEWNKKKIDSNSQEIAVAAIKFGMLKQDNNKIIVFDPDKEIRFDGETGPYIQYTSARANSILKGQKAVNPKLELLDSKEEFNLVKLLEQFPLLVEKSAKDYKPSIIANYLIDLSQSFNTFYHSHPVLKSEKDLMNARLVLVEKTKFVIGKGLELLGITPLNEM